MWLSLISWSICIDKLKLLTKQYIYNYVYLKVYFFSKFAKIHTLINKRADRKTMI